MSTVVHLNHLFKQNKDLTLKHAKTPNETAAKTSIIKKVCIKTYLRCVLFDVNLINCPFANIYKQDTCRKVNHSASTCLYLLKNTDTQWHKSTQQEMIKRSLYNISASGLTCLFKFNSSSYIFFLKELQIKCESDIVREVL